MTRARRTRSVVTLALLVGWVGSAPAQTTGLRDALDRGWDALRDGELALAGAMFANAVELPGGASSAEAWYGLSEVWWARGEALPSYMQLRTGQLMAAIPGWDPGPEGRFDAAIQERRALIEAAFGLVRLGPVDGLPPVATGDAAAARWRPFVEGLPGLLARAAEDGAEAVTVALPAGPWQVGDELLTLSVGPLDTEEPPVWTLPVATGAPPAEAAARREPPEGAAPGPTRAGALAATPPGTDAPPTRAVRRWRGYADAGLGLSTFPTVSAPAVRAQASASLGARWGEAARTVDLRLRWRTLPVPRCGAALARGHALGLRVGGTVGTSGTRVALSVSPLAGLGLGLREDGAWPDACQTPQDPPRYSVRVRRGGAQAHSSWTALGWRGTTLDVGAGAQVGLRFGAGRVRPAVLLDLAWQHVIPVLPRRAVLWLDGPDGPQPAALGTASPGLGASTLALGLAAAVDF